MPSRRTQKYCPDCGRHPEHARRQLEKHLSESIARCGTGHPNTPIENECAYCHKMFHTYKYTKTFCSSKCQHNYNVEHTTCQICGKPMIETSDRKITYPWLCSDKCKQTYRWQAAEKNHAVHICQHCGKKFIKTGPATFCNNDCYQAAVKAGWRPRQKQKRSLICPICRTLFTEGSGFGRYCSDACRQKGWKKQAALNKKFREEQTRQQSQLLQKEQHQKEQQASYENYIKRNGLCSICRTAYMDCERMSSEFRMSPKGAMFQGSIIVKCPKYTPPKKK